MSVHKPARLRAASRIGIVAPAGPVKEADLLAGVAAIRNAGYEPVWSDAIFARKGYFAGDQALRARDLLQYFGRDDIDAIFCARGGFGTVQLLASLECELKSQAKIFCGYSDVTILLNWLLQQRHMVTFHAPMVAMDMAHNFVGRTQERFWATLTGASDWNEPLGAVVRGGTAEGTIMGGCLSLLVTTLGTRYEIDSEGKILFLEDVGEKPYRIERMLTHLKMAGKLSAVAGVVLGDFTDCADGSERNLMHIVQEIFSEAPYPVVLGLAAGHGSENVTVPFGVRARLDARSPSLSLLESPVA